MVARTSKELLGSLLEPVSRSFYLTLRALPGAIRPQIGLAYLLARTTDTIADTEVLPREERLAALGAFRDRVLGRSDEPLRFEAFSGAQIDPAEQALLRRSEESLGWLKELSSGDLARVRDVLQVIISGQELDLRRFAQAARGSVVALEREEELDDYTYRVAGCVGEFWTRMCLAHLYARAGLDEAGLLRNGVRFGKGLQLVNILRDLPRDLETGRCYIPRDLLAAAGLTPADLADRTRYGPFRPVYEGLLRTAEGHLRAGWDYTNALPRWSVRVRLACAWPILIGLETIELLRGRNCLDAAERVKVGRPAVKKLMFRSVLLYPWAGAWKRMVAGAPDAR